jgi:hypothetical protein
MKQITSMAIDSQTVPQETTVVYLNKYYGITPLDRYAKGFITRELFDAGNFIVVVAKHMTNGNTWEIIGKSRTLAECINKARKGFTVYEFDTPVELFKWLVDEKA